MPKRVFVAPVLNAMGPVVDPRHSDLLASWEAVDAGVAKLFESDLRRCLLDSAGREVVVSWFPISWSGFTSNPVQRDFGWFTVYDHYLNRWGRDLARHGDGIYWMYNHPAASRVGNAWGLDWLDNCHYLEILNRMILHRGFFPGVVEIPTAEQHSTHFLEQYFPFQLGNRNCLGINWDNLEADGRRTRDVLQWSRAPLSWVPYRPSAADHQAPGAMNQFIFRLLDIKTRVLRFPEEEVIRAFEEARSGHDVLIAGYEHDFRDRSDAIIELFLAPVARIRQRYPDVQVLNARIQEAMIECTRATEETRRAPVFEVDLRGDYLGIGADQELFGSVPYVAVENLEGGKPRAVPPLRCGDRRWAVPLDSLPARCQVGVAGFSRTGLQSVLNVVFEAGRVFSHSVAPKAQIPYRWASGNG